jgi:hypothetical protein
VSFRLSDAAEPFRLGPAEREESEKRARMATLETTTAGEAAETPPFKHFRRSPNL